MRMTLICALLLLVHDCAAFSLGPRVGLSRHVLHSVATCPMYSVVMEAEGQEAADKTPAPPAYEPTEAEISEFMRDMPRAKDVAGGGDVWEGVAEKRARAAKILRETYDPIAQSKAAAEKAAKEKAAADEKAAKEKTMAEAP